MNQTADITINCISPVSSSDGGHSSEEDDLVTHDDAMRVKRFSSLRTDLAVVFLAALRQAT